MTPYQLKDGQRIHDLDTDDLIKRVNVMWAKLEITGRVHMVQYVRVKFVTEYEYTCEPPPAPIQGCALPPAHLAALQLEQDIEQARMEWRWPHVFMTPDSIGKVKNQKEWVAGVDADMSNGIRVCIRPPELHYYKVA